MSTKNGSSLFPAIPYKSWVDSKTTLHLFSQVVGKIRMALMPKQNHWWHVTLYLNARGMTTGSMPFEKGVAQIDFDFIDHVIRINSSEGEQREIKLGNLSVADFYQAMMNELGSCNIDVNIHGRPYDMPFNTPFYKDTSVRPWDAEAITRYWRVLTNIEAIMQEFRGWFLGKATPVQLFWHSFDLAYTRFSGREAPAMDGGTQADREAYSHEVISFGFWAGDENVPFPAFYSYTWPEPKGLNLKHLKPEAASWVENNGSHMALLPYDDMRKEENPRKALLDFYQSAYLAGANLANWDSKSFKTPWG